MSEIDRRITEGKNTIDVELDTLEEYNIGARIARVNRCKFCRGKLITDDKEPYAIMAEFIKSTETEWPAARFFGVCNQCRSIINRLVKGGL